MNHFLLKETFKPTGGFIFYLLLLYIKLGKQRLLLQYCELYRSEPIVYQHQL